ncbi:hypothetical protein BDW59DRAFT_164209 [Aspergillus cavernicola]|uniref:Uncharacterized protein n=1 Tax=Aspergillus cavernicola TaxID=176166 RepID=A0ABR4I0S3_9EURO
MPQAQPSPFVAEFYNSLAQLQPSSHLKWYQTAIVALGAPYYPEEIPTLYKLLLERYIPKESQFNETQKIREEYYQFILSSMSASLIPNLASTIDDRREAPAGSLLPFLNSLTGIEKAGATAEEAEWGKYNPLNSW